MTERKPAFSFRTTELKPRGRGSFQDAHGTAVADQDDHDERYLHVVVADGHGPGGERAAKIAVSTILDGIGPIADARQLVSSFLEAHDRICLDDAKGGCTATFVRVAPGRVIVGWVGNSEARIVRRDGKFRTLAIPHEFGRHRHETSRLRKAGADIISRHAAARYGFDDRSDAVPKRGRVQVGNVSLEVSRALGDAEFDPFVLHVPEVREFPVSADDRFLVVASDGFWHPATGRTTKRHLIERQLAEAASLDDAQARIVALLSRWKVDDDLTLIIVDLDP